MRTGDVRVRKVFFVTEVPYCPELVPLAEAQSNLLLAQAPSLSLQLLPTREGVL